MYIFLNGEWFWVLGVTIDEDMSKSAANFAMGTDAIDNFSFEIYLIRYTQFCCVARQHEWTRQCHLNETIFAVHRHASRDYNTYARIGLISKRFRKVRLDFVFSNDTVVCECDCVFSPNVINMF